MDEEIYINASCLISHQAVYKNGVSVFKNTEAKMPAFLTKVYHHFGIKYPKFYKMDDLSKLGWLAAEILLTDSFKGERYPREQIGVILANASSSLDTDIKYYETTRDIASPALFVYTLPNIVIGEICIRHNFKGEQAFFIFDHFDADFIVQNVRHLFINNILQACICGWVELLDEQYKTVLFLVEKAQQGSAILFTTENIIKTYQSANG